MKLQRGISHHWFTQGDNPPPITKEKAGCGKLIHIAGTNGGRMPCGEKLTRQDGTVTIELCPLCKAKGTHA